MAAETFRGCVKRACTPAESLFGRRTCFAGLRGLFSDGAKGMHACANIFRTETSRRTFPGAKDSVGSVRLMSSEGRTEAPKNTGPPDQRTITWPYSRSGDVRRHWLPAHFRALLFVSVSTHGIN